MRRVVLHSSAFAGWLSGDRPPELRAAFEAGKLEVLVPRSFLADTLADLASAGWTLQRLSAAGTALERVGFRVADPPVSELAAWLSRGFDRSIAPYAALASFHDLPIALGDPDLARRLHTLPQA